MVYGQRATTTSSVAIIAIMTPSITHDVADLA
jgi:hypothetical protein